MFLVKAMLDVYHQYDKCDWVVYVLLINALYLGEYHLHESPYYDNHKKLNLIFAFSIRIYPIMCIHLGQDIQNYHYLKYL